MAVLVLLHVLPPLLKPSSFVQDDSYFYMQVASNIARGNGSTFLGITPTNGYHPLWMLGAVIAVLLAAGSKALALHVVVAVQIELAVVAAVLLDRLLRAMRFEFRLASIAVLLTYLLGTSMYGSEAHLNAVMLTAGLLSLWRSLGDHRLPKWFTTGVLFGLAVLARLDNVFMVAALCALGVLHDAKGDFRVISKRAGAALAGGILVLAPYLAYNMLQFGHLMPISGAIKTVVPVFNWDLGRLGKMGRIAAPFGLVAIVIGSVVDESRSRRVLWLGVGCGVVAHAVFITVFTDHYTFWPWYYVSGVLAASLTAAYVPQWVAARVSTRSAAAVIRPVVMLTTIGILCAGAGRTWVKAFSPVAIGPVLITAEVNEYRWNEEFAGWRMEHLPPRSAVFVTDWPGVLAYYSDRRVLPMDGLVNDFRYNDELLAVGPEAYLCGHGFRYVFAGIEGGVTQRLEVEAPLYRKQAGTLTLQPRDVLVKVRDVVSRPERTPAYAMWRLTCPGT
jgi:hypothetical protein